MGLAKSLLLPQRVSLKRTNKAANYRQKKYIIGAFNRHFFVPDARKFGYG